MSRKTKISGLTLSIIFLVLGLLVAGCYIFAFNKSSDASFRKVERLDPNIYYENAVSLRGNTYRIDAEIDSSLGSPPAIGRLFSVVVKDAKESTPVVLPVLIPPALGSLTIEKGQHYYLKVKVDDRGLLIAERQVKSRSVESRPLGPKIIFRRKVPPLKARCAVRSCS